MDTYREIQDRIYTGPEMVDCFYAFGRSQMEEGIKKFGLEGKKLYHAGAGLYGTDEGLRKYIEERVNQIEKSHEEIREKCTPQTVYNYEFDNHECGYIHDDTDAVRITLTIFGLERFKNEVKRRSAYCDVDAVYKELKK